MTVSRIRDNMVVIHDGKLARLVPVGPHLWQTPGLIQRRGRDSEGIAGLVWLLVFMASLGMWALAWLAFDWVLSFLR